MIKMVIIKGQENFRKFLEKTRTNDPAVWQKAISEQREKANRA